MSLNTPHVGFALIIVLLFMAPLAWAFNPPEDQAGPLKVRIEAPEKVTATDTPQAVHVVLTSEADTAIDGALRVQGTDAWRVTPADPAPFHVVKGAPVQFEFTVSVGAETYNALYPIHAFAEFSVDGVSQTAHAVAIVETQLPNPPRPQIKAPWQPLVLQENSALSLVRSPIYRALIQVFGEAPQSEPPGWHGTDGRTRASLMPTMRVARPDGREALGIHPPWYEGLAGTMLVEFPVRLPETKPIVLRFANAIRDTTSSEPPSDGVTFRVRALPFDAPDNEIGETLYERHSASKQWEDAEVDLSRFAGTAIRIQVESHPGPKKDTTCDQSYWAGLTVASGTPEAPRATLGDAQLIGTAQHFDVRVRMGSRGLLDGQVAFSNGSKTLAFKGFPMKVAGEDVSVPGGVTEFLGSWKEDLNGAIRVRHQLRNLQGTFDLFAELSTENGQALRARFWIENAPPPEPWSVVYIEDVAAGPWSETAARVYAGVGNVLERPGAFDLPFDGHQLASSYIGLDFSGVSIVQGTDVAPNRFECAPEARVYTIHTPLAQVMRIVPASNISDAVRVWRELDSRKAAGGVERLAGRFVFDLWGGTYGQSAQALAESFKYGLTDSVVVWHNWQRWGYDYRLPDIFPPNPAFGTSDEFAVLAETCKSQGVLFAPHDNYIDFYPDAEGFSYTNVAFTRDGDPIRAWLNEGRGAQAFRWRADAYRPFMERNVGLIRDAFAPTAYFIDVFSSIGPYDAWTSDGQFQDRVLVRNTWGETFAWIRDQLGGAPQISESGHDQLTGYLDGAQCNHLRVDAHPSKDAWCVWRVPCEDAERVPWLDLAYHDRFALHGAGYENRYAGGLDTAMHGIYSDDYIATEVLDGHPAMVPEAFSRNVVRKYWLLHDLMRALARKRIESIEFVNGNIHTQHVRWEDGGETWVNRGESDWIVGEHVLPAYGFYAHAGGAEAAIERRDGLIVEWSRSPEAQYVNARPVIDDRVPIQVSAETVQLTGERTVSVALVWTAQKPLPEAARIFAHFVDKAGKIALQADCNPPVPTTEWQGTVRTLGAGSLPEGAQPGDTFELRVGLWRPETGRLALQGFSDEEQRVRLGTVRLEGEGTNIARIAWTPLEPQPDPVLARQNPQNKPVEFAGVRTDGGCRLTKDGEGLLITPLPKSVAFTVSIDPQAIPFGLSAPNTLESLADDGSFNETVLTTREVGRAAVRIEAGAFRNRLVAR